MMPNLRYNKSLTRTLIKSSPNEEDKITLASIKWNMENKKNVYGLVHHGLFKTTVFFLQCVENEQYRLVVSDGSPYCNIYIIDNIEKFVDAIGLGILDWDNMDEVYAALEETATIPATGILIIDDNEVYLYDHKKY